GTDVTGLTALGNAYGLAVNVHCDANRIGGTSPGARNVISGNAVNGVDIRSSTNSVLGNFIGVNHTGTNVLANGGHGVFVFMHPALGAGTNALNVIGGDAPGAANVISGNAGNGVVMSQDGPPLQTRVKGNFIGTDFTGTLDLGNGGNGVNLTAFFDAAITENVIGDTTPNVIAFNKANGVEVSSGASNLIAGNLIYSNAQAGVSVDFYIGGNSNNTITANTILSNSGDGVLVDSTANSVLGNHIYSNALHGVTLQGASATNNLISANSIFSNN